MTALFSVWEIPIVEKFLNNVEDEIRTKEYSPLSTTIIDLVFEILYTRLKDEQLNAEQEVLANRTKRCISNN